jgi:hypothetical protein
MSAQDLINRVKQRRLSMPTSGVPPTIPPRPVNPNTPPTTTPPSTPTFTIISPVPSGGFQSSSGSSSGSSSSSDSGGRSFFDKFSAIGPSAFSIVGDAIKGLPQVGKDLAMTGVGIGEGVFDTVADLTPFEYTSRADKRRQQAKEMGLKGYEALNYEMAHTLPFITKMADSFQATGSNLLDPLQVVGGKDFGEPGINYVNAFNRGELGRMLVEDAGTVILAGRLTGAGNLGVRAGSAVTAAGSPRLGSAISTAGRFVEEPIASTTRGAARLTNVGLKQTGLLPKVADAAGRISTANQPLRTTVTETVAGKRKFFDKKLEDILVKEAGLNEKLARLDLDDPERITVSKELRSVENTRLRYLSATGKPKLMAKEIKRLQLRAEGFRTGWVTKVNRWTERGSAPETIQELTDRGFRALEASQKARDAGDAELAAEYEQISNYYLDTVNTKRADTTGRLDPKNWTPEERSTIWSSAVLIMTKVREEIMARYNQKIAEGLTPAQAIDWVTQNIRPPELHPDIASQGYAWTRPAIERTINFSLGKLDRFDVLNLTGAGTIINEFSQWFNSQAEQGIGRVTGAIPFTYRYDLPDPMNLLRELEGRPKLKELITEVLDKSVATILERDYMDVVTDQKIDLDNPTRLFENFAKKRFDSDEYRIAYEALSEAYPNLVADQQFTAFMLNKMIYPAAMRPMMGSREQFVQAARGEDIQFMGNRLAELAVQNQDLLPSRTLASIATAINKALGDQTKFDARTWIRLRATLQRVINDADKAKAEYEVTRAKLDTGIDTTMARLSEIEQFATAAMLMIDQVINNPLQVFPELLEGTPRLVAARQAEQANLSRIDAIPNEIAQIDAEIKAEVDRQKTANAYLQQELDNTQVSLEQARTRATETADAEATVRQQLDQEQAYLDAYNKLTEEELAALRSPDGEEQPFDLKKAMEIHDTYATGNNFVSKGTAQGVKNRLVREATERLTIARGLVDSLMPSRLRRARTMTIGLATDPNAMSFMQEDFRAPFESAVYQAIGDPKLAKKAYNDFVNSRTVMDEGVAVDQLSMETGRDFASDSDFMAELGRAWAEQWQAEKDLGRAKQKGVEAIRKELAADNQAMIDQAMEASTVTGQTLPWIERMIELDDRATLAEATRTVEGLRRDLAKAEQAAQKAQADLNRLAAKVAKLTDQARPKVPNELLTRRSKLEKESETTKKATRRLAGVVERAQKAEPKAMDALLARAQRARLVGVGKLTPTGEGGMLPGLAGKLEADQQTLLVRQTELVEKLNDVRDKFADQDSLGQEAQSITDRASAMEDMQGAPAGPQLLSQSQYPQLRGEGTTPAWYPAGETASVAEATRVITELRTEAAGAERQAQTEGTKTTNVMAMDSNRFAERVKEILGQYVRNVVIQGLIENRDFVTQVSKYLDETQLADIDMKARRKIAADNPRLDSAQFERLVKEDIGLQIKQRLNELGLEPISSTQMPEPGDIYTGRAALNTLTDIVPNGSIGPTTLVMPKGMRERVASSFTAVGDTMGPTWLSRGFKLVGTATSKWKSVILPLSVRWQVGDYMGNVINAWVRGDIPVTEMVRVMRLADEMIKQDSKLGNLSARTSGMTNRSFSNPVLAALIGEGIQGRSLRADDIIQMLEGTKKGRPKTEVNPRFGRDFRAKAFNFNEYQNTQARLAVAMIKLQELADGRGFDLKDIDPITLHNTPDLHKAVVEAVQFANETLGAFSELSPFERQYVRTVYPFWSWVKFINTAAFKLLIDNPDRVLFYAHLGSMTMEPEAEGLYDWLQGMTPVGGYLMDLSFTNPYADAIIFKKNPLEVFSSEFTSFSPVIDFGLKAGGEIVYGQSGQRRPVLSTVSRPSYLEGRPGTTTRTVGDTLGGIAYMGLKSFGGPLRNILDVGPVGRIPGTDIATGPVPRFPQGSARTEGRYAEPRLSQNVSRLSSFLRTFGLPAPTISIEEARRQAEEQRFADEEALLRRMMERINAG